jgi:sulfhydrogenase subunit delta
MKKLRVGFFSFTCCEGCTLVFLEALNSKFDSYSEKLDLIHIRVLKPIPKKFGKLDVAFVEGAICNKEELKKLKEIRKNSKKVVALGSGAINGWPSNLSNDFDKEKMKVVMPMIKKLKQFKKILPLHEYVKVDDKIEGCPISSKDLIAKIDKYFKEFENA